MAAAPGSMRWFPHAVPTRRSSDLASGSSPNRATPTASWTPRIFRRNKVGLMSETARLLVVDDEANIRDLLAAALRFAGFAVTTASNGNEALTLVREERPDLIVLDVMMPDMDGFTVTRRLRARGDDMPVLFLTARLPQGCRERVDGGWR